MFFSCLVELVIRFPTTAGRLHGVDISMWGAKREFNYHGPVKENNYRGSKWINEINEVKREEMKLLFGKLRTHAARFFGRSVTINSKFGLSVNFD